MRIIHTADWHIGKNLHKVPMQDELRAFFDWLIKTIIERDIQLLLVSGDIFDYANPSAEDRKMYFHFLKRLIDTDTKIIITGGNHDSAGFLNAPKEILGALDISVIGEATENMEDEIIEVFDAEGSLNLVVAAVPFLKDKDLRHRDQRHQYNNRTDEIRAGIARHYEQLGIICAEKYAEVPCIAMGHLYAIGADPSDSERDIHMGNEAAVDSAIFPEVFDYVALGHIHRPQIIGKNEYIRYSGSPIALSFSEKKDLKSVVLFEVSDKAITEPQVIAVPKRRALIRITGSFEEVNRELNDFESSHPLPAFIEVILKEPSFSSMIISKWEEAKQEFQENPYFKIIRDKIEFKKGAKDISELFEPSVSIEELTPIEVFNKKIEAEELDAKQQTILRNAFTELLEMMNDED
ncbi:exonuclease SbcCD subunit D C-terminal domain-containing protein [Portibacter marinus]|uniref:exonuclease SbcCD subunit D C-terminal domain-containing protein n=1 Tax=Portibacter marinus TaxID=2898660 RepID=UPI001F1A1C8C|nr:exonuclease SbcCD subunit D C-terminal domain-containing protein [Portibacter marinus]